MKSKSHLTVFLLLALTVSTSLSSVTPTLHQINDDNWTDILTGEWMVEFFAPWCPACQNLQPVWEEFSTWAKDLNIAVGQVDITKSAGLSGRFMITALPTIFHVKDGVFRQYKGSRSKDEFLTFIEDKKWEHVEPMSSWQSPSSIQMSLISQFYRISMGLRNLMNFMVEEYKIPTWGVYIIFGLATIVVGLILGLVLVCCIDFIYPPAPPTTLPRKKSDASENGNGSGTSENEKEQEEEEGDFTEDIQDDVSQDEAEARKSDADVVKEPEPRRRKVRKAD